MFGNLIEFFRKLLKYVILWACVILCIKIETCECCSENKEEEPLSSNEHIISRPTPIKDKLQEKILKELD